MESGARRVVNRVLVACGGGDGARLVAGIQGGGMEAVAVFTSRNSEAPWLDDADYATQLEPGVDPLAVLSAALDAGADAVHPGSGAWARSAALAQLAANVGLLWVGPPPAVLNRIGDAAAVRSAAKELGLSTLPVSPVLHQPDELRAWVERLGPPLMVHALGEPAPHTPATSRYVATGAELRELLERPPSGALVVERVVPGARRVVVVIVADGGGGAVAVGDHEDAAIVDGQVWMRDCPAELPGVDVRPTLHNTAARLAVALGVRGVLAVSFQVGADAHVWVEDLWPGLPAGFSLHDIVSGVDLVGAQMALAAGDELGWSQAQIVPLRHAIAVTVYATSEGVVESLELPPDFSWEVVQDERAEVDPAHDPVLFRLTVDGPTRHAALVKAGVALAAVRLTGVESTLGRLRALLGGRPVWEGRTGLRLEVPPADAPALTDRGGAAAPTAAEPPAPTEPDSNV